MNSYLLRQTRQNSRRLNNLVSVALLLLGIMLIGIALAHYYTWLTKPANNLGAVIGYLVFGLAAELFAIKLRTD
jgi:ABC-type spermidine/putrescine transport system permease subunit II